MSDIDPRLDRIARLPNGDRVVCRFYEDETAAVRVNGFWINLDGEFEQNDTKAVVAAYLKAAELTREGMVAFEQEQDGIETGVIFVDDETITSPEFMEIPEEPIVSLDDYPVEEIPDESMDEVYMEGGIIASWENADG